MKKRSWKIFLFISFVSLLFLFAVGIESSSACFRSCQRIARSWIVKTNSHDVYLKHSLILAKPCILILIGGWRGMMEYEKRKFLPWSNEIYGNLFGRKMEKRFFLSGITTFFEWLDFLFWTRIMAERKFSRGKIELQTPIIPLHPPNFDCLSSTLPICLVSFNWILCMERAAFLNQITDVWFTDTEKDPTTTPKEQWQK